MTIPPLPKPPIRRLPRGCDFEYSSYIQDDDGYSSGYIYCCPHQALSFETFDGVTHPCCAFHLMVRQRAQQRREAVMMTGGVSWTEMIERAGDE